MFHRNDDYEGVNWMDSDSLRASEVRLLRDKLQDIIDRLYDKEIPVNFEEIDCSLKRMGNILGVYVPDTRLDHHEKVTCEYIESVLYTWHKMSEIYYIFRNNSPAAIDFFLIRKDDLLEFGIKESDIRKFCDSEFYKKRVKESENVF